MNAFDLPGKGIDEFEYANTSLLLSREQVSERLRTKLTAAQNAMRLLYY